MVTLLSGTRNREGDARRMPGSDTGDLAETLVGLAWELLCVPTRGDTVVTATLGDANGVDHLVLGEDRVDGDLLLEVLVAPVDLLVNGTAVDLDLDEVAFFWRRESPFICVWQMARMETAYFLSIAKSRSMDFLPSSDSYFFEDLVKAFFLEENQLR